MGTLINNESKLELGLKSTVPILIDDVKRYSSFNWTRCTYFSIECDTPISGWQLAIDQTKIPFLMIGLSGVIYVPIDGSKKFDSPKKLEDLFEEVESIEDIFIDINDIYLPNSYFKLEPFPTRGSVFRIPLIIFEYGLKYKNGLISGDIYKDICENQAPMPPQFEVEETDSIRIWSKMQINEASRNYHRDARGMRLSKI